MARQAVTAEVYSVVGQNRPIVAVRMRRRPCDATATRDMGHARATWVRHGRYAQATAMRRSRDGRLLGRGDGFILKDRPDKILHWKAFVDERLARLSADGWQAPVYRFSCGNGAPFPLEGAA